MTPEHSRTHLFQSLKRGLSILSILSMLVFGLYGCGSGSGTDTTGANGDSELVISLTDAEGDFLSYTVDVQSIKMLRNNGAEVETLPLTTQLDFARYVEVTEFLTAATVPSGHYVGAQIVLDFSNAVITVQDDNGNAINATPQDTNGNPAGLLTVDLSFNGNSDFVIAPGIPAHITLDFDLDASNNVIINGTAATVIVKPVLIADTLLERPKPHRLRGILGRVDEAAQSFNVLMRPFRHRLNNRFGQLQVQTSDRTSFEIDGVVYNNTDGITQLASLNPAAAIVVLGEVTPKDAHSRKRSFNALEVYAGNSVPWGTKDIVSGNVISRSANTLVIRGATLIRTDGSFAFNDNVTVTMDENTRVVKQADFTGSYTTTDVSVGQQLTVTGTITDNTRLALNADHVRMNYTNVGGSVVSVSPLAVNLQNIDRRRIALFNFAGTGSGSGTDMSTDADAGNYEVDSGSLSLSNLQIGAPLIVRGHVRPFASAPEDFTARTLLDASSMRAHLVAGYASGSLTAISSISESGLLLDLQEAGDRHHMIRAGISTDLLSLSSVPVIVPTDSGNGLYVIVRDSAVRVYTDFSSFRSALNSALDGNTLVTSVHANGQYDANLNQLVSAKVNIRLTGL